MTNRLITRTETQTRPGSVREQRAPRILVLGIIGLFGVVGLGLLAVPILIGTNAFFATGAGCSGQQTGTAGQPTASAKAKSIPANYLFWYKKVGQQYGVPWPILAGIGTVESDNGQSALPGVHSGQNGFGAAGPMQIGIGGASGNTWGGLPVHPASQVVSGVATSEDGGPNADVYNPADAIAGAAKYLLEFQVQTNPSAAIFAYNHLQSYVQSVLYYAGAVRGRELLRGVRANAVGQFGGRLRPDDRGRCPPSRRRPRPWPPPSRSPSSSSASRTCGAAPGRTPSTAPAW